MKRLLAAVVALGVVSGVGLCAGASDSALEGKILGLEAKRIEAMVKKDIATLDALLADDLTYTHSGGTTDTKASFITLIKERGRYQGVDYSNTQVIPFAGGTTCRRTRARADPAGRRRRLPGALPRRVGAA